MASYNQVNMRPNTVNPDLATLERSWSDQTLMNVTDASADYNVFPGYLPDREHSVAAAIKAGIDSFTTDDTDPSGTQRCDHASAHRPAAHHGRHQPGRGPTLTIRFGSATSIRPARTPTRRSPRLRSTTPRIGRCPGRPRTSRWCC